MLVILMLSLAIVLHTLVYQMLLLFLVNMNIGMLLMKAQLQLLVMYMLYVTVQQMSSFKLSVMKLIHI